MKFSTLKVHSFRPTAVAVLSLLIPGIVAPSALLFASPGPAFAQESSGLESAPTSKLIGLKLPSGGFRAMKEEMVSQFAGPLDKLAATVKGQIGKREILIWPKDADPRAKMAGFLKAAGYQYAPQDVIHNDAGDIIPFTLSRKDNKGAPLVGFWLESDKACLLAWGTVVSGRAPSDGETNGGPDATEKPSVGGSILPGGDAGESAPAANTEAPPTESGAKAGASMWEPAPQSRIAPIKLPAKAARSLNASFNDKLAMRLRQAVDEAGYSVTPVEALVWEGEAAADMPGNRNAVVNALRKAGYEIQTQAPTKTEQGNLYLFMATNSKTKAGYIGYFLEGPIQIFVWGKLVKN